MNLVIRRGIVLVAAALGGLFALGSLIALMFELQGFGNRDGDASVPYVLLLAAAFAASVGIPLILWRALLPGAPTRTFVATVICVGAVVFVLLGVSLR